MVLWHRFVAIIAAHSFGLYPWAKALHDHSQGYCGHYPAEKKYDDFHPGMLYPPGILSACTRPIQALVFMVSLILFPMGFLWHKLGLLTAPLYTRWIMHKTKASNAVHHWHVLQVKKGDGAFVFALRTVSKTLLLCFTWLGDIFTVIALNIYPASQSSTTIPPTLPASMIQTIRRLPTVRQTRCAQSITFELTNHPPHIAQTAKNVATIINHHPSPETATYDKDQQVLCIHGDTAIIDHWATLFPHTQEAEICYGEQEEEIITCTMM